MALSEMFTAMPGSPKATTTAEVGTSATTIPVSDVSVFPSGSGNLPNLAVLGEDENAEIIQYQGISGSSLTGVTRGMGNTTASTWPAGTVIARNFTSLDHDLFVNNIRSLDNEKAPKANAALSGVPTAPTADPGTSTTQIATTAFVASALSGKADSVHTHDASAITSGILDKSYGGTGNQTGTASLATTAADTTSTLYPVGVTSGATTALKRDTSVSMSGGTVTATTFSGALTGNASTATKLETARTIRTNLASTTAVSFDGSAAVTPGVTGTLPLDNGGTGATTAHGAVAALFADNVGTSATYFLTRTNSWQACGYSSLAQVKSMMGVSDSGEQTLTSESIDGDVYYRKFGPLVSIYGSFKPTSTVTSSTTGATLAGIPSAYRPTRTIWCWAGNPNTSNAEAGAISITTSGAFKFWKPKDLSSWPTDLLIYFSVTYFTA